jgi:hypothetical protein
MPRAVWASGSPTSTARRSHASPGIRVAHDALTAEIKKTEAELGGGDALFGRLLVPLRRSDHDIDGAIAYQVLGSISSSPISLRVQRAHGRDTKCVSRRASEVVILDERPWVIALSGSTGWLEKEARVS